MSSSRSIAAARNRRAMEQQQPNLLQRSRPNTSIASQPAFSQVPSSQQAQQAQFMQQANQKRNLNQYNQNNPNQKNINKPNRNFQSGTAPGSIPVAVNKISVSDAIGLITIRLGRVEQFMQSLDEQGFLLNSSSNDENKIVVSKEMLDNLTERLYSLENQPTPIATFSDIPYKNSISELEKEIFSLKETIKQQTNKIDHLMIETENKFIDIENAFIDLEKKELLTEEQEKETKDNDENIQLILKDVSVEEEMIYSLEPTFSKVDLKSIINNELANEIIN